jgi:hypothetical protein
MEDIGDPPHSKPMTVQLCQLKSYIRFARWSHKLETTLKLTPIPHYFLTPPLPTLVSIRVPKYDRGVGLLQCNVGKPTIQQHPGLSVSLTILVLDLVNTRKTDGTPTQMPVGTIVLQLTTTLLQALCQDLVYIHHSHRILFPSSHQTRFHFRTVTLRPHEPRLLMLLSWRHRVDMLSISHVCWSGHRKGLRVQYVGQNSLEYLKFT